MIYRFLRRFRIVWACLFLLAATACFVSVSLNLSRYLSVVLLWQFVPTVITALVGGGVATLVFIFLLTLVFGRVYCSFLCPLGLYQDAVSRVASWFKSKKQRRTHYHKACNAVRYGILVFCVLALILGLSYPLRFLDPYGIFGKIATNLWRPVVLAINNGLSALFPNQVFYQSYTAITWSALAVAGLYFIVVTVLSAWRGRLYCNLICPVGSFLGLISRFSMFRIRVNMDKCKHCMLCGMHCKAECLDSKTASIDHSRCVACFNCMKACKENALVYGFAWCRQQKEKQTPDVRRRRFLQLGAGMAVGAAGALALRGFEKKPVAEDLKIKGSMPPGSETLELFKDRCVACHACVSACPSHIIRPALNEYGPTGLLLPVIHYDNGFCAYDCKACMDVCPTDALQKMPLEDKQKVRIGRASVRQKNCIIVKDGTDCGACDEHCPVKAVRITKKRNSDQWVPVIHINYCIGCGACEFICPAVPKAIHVTPFDVQETALPPEVEEQQKQIHIDFGF